MPSARLRLFWFQACSLALLCAPVHDVLHAQAIHGTAQITRSWKSGEYYTGVEAGAYNEEVGSQRAIVQIEPATQPEYPGQTVGSGSASYQAVKTSLQNCFDGSHPRPIGTYTNTIVDTASGNFVNTPEVLAGPSVENPPRVLAIVASPRMTGTETTTDETGCGPPPGPVQTHPFTAPGLATEPFYLYPVEGSTGTFAGSWSSVTSSSETRPASEISSEETIIARVTVVASSCPLPLIASFTAASPAGAGSATKLAVTCPLLSTPDLAPKLKIEGLAPQAAAPACTECRECNVPALSPITDPDALAYENGNTLNVTGLTSGTQTALSCLESAVSAAGGSMHVSSAFRPPPYQEHLQEVWDLWNDLRNRTEPECQTQRSQLQAEFSKHGLMLTQRPANNSPHTTGHGFDANVTLPPGQDIDALAAACGLNRPVPVTDPVHFVH